MPLQGSGLPSPVLGQLLAAAQLTLGASGPCQLLTKHSGKGQRVAGLDQ